MEKWGLALLLLFLGGKAAVRSWERGVADDFRSKLVGQAGKIDFRTAPHDVFGYAEGYLASARLLGSGFASDGLPLYTEPQFSRCGRIGTLKLRFTDMSLAGLSVKRLDADLPDCRFDKAYAVSKKRIRLTRCGTGTVRVDVSAQAIADFAMRKYPMLSGAVVHMKHGRFEISGNAALAGKTSFRLAGALEVQGGLVYIVQPEAEFGGTPMSAEASKALVDSLNPIIDPDKDLHLLDTLSIRRLTLDDDLLVVEGEVRIPVKPELKAEDGKR